MRAAAESQDENRKSDKALVKFTGGALTVKDYLRWVRALPPQYTSQLREANDTMLTKFARILAQNVLLLREADENKITITPLEWASLKHHYEGQLDTLRTEMGLQDGDVTDSSVAAAERSKVAGAQGRAVFRPAHRRQGAPPAAAVGPRHAAPRPAAVCRPRRRREPGRRAGDGAEGQGGRSRRRRIRCSAHPVGRRCRACPRRPVPRPDPAHRRPARRHRAPGVRAAHRGFRAGPRRAGAAREASVTSGWRRSLLFAALALVAPVAGAGLAAQDSAGVTAPPVTPPAADSAAAPRAGPARTSHRGAVGRPDRGRPGRGHRGQPPRPRVTGGRGDLLAPVAGPVSPTIPTPSPRSASRSSRRSSTRSCWSSRRSGTPPSRSPTRRSRTASSSRSGRSGPTSLRKSTTRTSSRRPDSARPRSTAAG